MRTGIEGESDRTRQSLIAPSIRERSKLCQELRRHPPTLTDARTRLERTLGALFGPDTCFRTVVNSSQHLAAQETGKDPTHGGGRPRARLRTTAAHHNATLSGGAAPPRDVPRPSHRERSYGLRCAVLTDSFGYGVRTAATRAQSPGSRLIPAFLTTGTAASIYNGKTDLPLENVSTIGMDSSWAGSAVSGLSPRITRSACFPTVIEPFVSSSKY